MTFLVAVAVVLTVCAAVAVVREVRSGGRTPTAPPAHEWTDDAQPPERPYRDLPWVA